VSPVPSGRPIGSLAVEAVQLLDAVTAALLRMKDATVETTISTHTCVPWCPVCRGTELLRGEGSEVTTKLVDTALSLMTTLRSLVPEPSAAAPGDHPDQTSRVQQPGVERIIIR